jgi:hypothetical protein
MQHMIPLDNRLVNILRIPRSKTGAASGVAPEETAAGSISKSTRQEPPHLELLVALAYI